jgi:hypothetical protein
MLGTKKLIFFYHISGNVTESWLLKANGAERKWNLRFEIFTAVTVKNVVFWDVTPCGSCKNRRFAGT